VPTLDVPEWFTVKIYVVCIINVYGMVVIWIFLFEFSVLLILTDRRETEFYGHAQLFRNSNGHKSWLCRTDGVLCVR
jgi:hypothetical protein